MIEKIFDAILALIFTAFTVFSTSAIYNFVKRETLTQVSKGLSPMTPFQRAIDPTHYSWEDVSPKR
jgi:hypothetical protein